MSQYRATQQLEAERLKQASFAFSESLTHRIDAYTEIAFGLRSLFVINPGTSRRAFEEAVVRLEVEKRYPGIKNIAFTRYVTAAQRSAFEKAVRRDTSLEPAGYPAFAIRPAGERPEYFVADYLWPQSGSKGVHGLDISAQPANLASMRFAMATGLPTASGPFDLIQEVTDKTGFVVRVPVFSNAPTATFLGSVAVTIRVQDLFAALEREGLLKGLHVALTDVGSSIPDAPVSKPVPLYAKDEAGHRQGPLSSLERDIYGRRWKVDAHAESSYLSQSEQQLPLLLTVGGVVISILLGVLTGLLGQGRRRALDTLATTNALLQSVLDHVPIRVFWKDRSGRYLGCNQLFAQDAGRANAREVVGCMDDELAWKQEASLYQRDDQMVMDSGESRLRFVEPQSNPSGRTMWLQTSKVPLRNPQGEVVGILGVYDDITERRVNDNELAQYRANLEHMVSDRTTELEAANRLLRDTQFAMDSVGIGIYWVDVDNATLLDMNRFASDLLGYPMEQLRGMSLAKIFPNGDLTGFHALVERVRSASHGHGEFLATRADGSVVPVDVVAYYQEKSQDHPQRMTAFVTDITDRKAAEGALLAARSAAESANAAKSAFLANMSHEIRTPLNAITGMAYLIRRSGLSGEQAERLAKLELASEHLLHIIDDILEIAKIEAGKFTLLAQPVRVETLLNNVATMLQARAAAKGLRFTVQMAPLPVGLEGDVTRLQQCLLNYASNAIKFSEQGEIALRADCVSQTDEAVTVRFEVEDTGIGIEPDALVRLFNVFEQADNSITRKFGGTGLGLAITRKLAELMGGEAGASSVPGKGSLFWFTCVLRKGGAFEGAHAPALENAEEALRRVASGRRVLMAEDDAFNQEVGRILLEQVGLAVDLVDDGQAAVDNCSARPYDLVLMDLQMPRMDGIEAARRIRQLEGYAAVPILAITANTASDDRERCMLVGMNDFITKPVAPQALYEKLLVWLLRQHG